MSLRALLDPDGDEALRVQVSDATLALAATLWRQGGG